MYRLIKKNSYSLKKIEMKKSFKTLFLFIGMSMFAVCCQKENIVEPGITTGEMQDYISISYIYFYAFIITCS